MDEQNIEIQNEKSISFSEILLLLKKYIWHVVAIVLVCTILASVAAVVMAKPKYSAKSTIMVNYVPNGDTVADDRNALLYGLDLVTTVSDFATTNIVQSDVKKVVAENQNSNVEVNYKSGLSIVTEEGNLIITIQYTTKTGGAQAVETVNQVVDSIINVANSSQENGESKYRALYKTLVKVDESDKYTVSQTWPTYVMLGVVLGVVLAVAYIILRFLLDDTIKSKTELERITGFKAIAFIEDIEAGK